MRDIYFTGRISLFSTQYNIIHKKKKYFITYFLKIFNIYIYKIFKCHLYIYLDGHRTFIDKHEMKNKINIQIFAVFVIAFQSKKNLLIASKLILRNLIIMKKPYLKRS